MNQTKQHTEKNKQKKRRMWVFIRIGVSILILVLLALYLPISTFLDSLKKASLIDWGGCVAGAVLIHILGVFKWRLQLKANHVQLGFVDATSCYCAGLFANVCLPSVVGGDVLRSSMAIRVIGRKLAVILGSLMDRLGDVIALYLLTVLSCFFVSASLGSQRHGLLIIFALVIVLGVGLGIGLLFYHPSQWLPTSVRRQLKRLRLALWRVIRNYRLAIFALGLSLCIQSCFVLLNAFLANGIGIMMPVGIWFFAWPLAKLTALVPISLGGLGVQELTLTGLLKPFGVTPSQALAQALLWRGVFVATGLAGGFIWVALKKINWWFTNTDATVLKKKFNSIQTNK